VLFCDLVDSTVLASQLDPEDLREVVRAYQETCAKVIARFEGHIAQYLGDGLLVYFGYPLAHEDDAQRAVRAGLGIVEALGQLNTRLAQERGVHLAVRLGVHTGLVVVGDVGGGTRQEQLALGETPNLTARLQSIAAPNSLVISAATLPLLGGFFACQSLGTPLLKGFAQPLDVYRVLSESTARSRLDVAASTGLTPLVGREQEIGLLRERWEHVKDGMGQVVLLSGEPGIGKTALVEMFLAEVGEANALRMLDHPNLVAAVDVFVEAGYLFLVMEYVRGRTLTKILAQDGRMQPRRALVIARQLLDGVGHAHSQGLIHRDLKPDNIMLVDMGGWERAKIVDFGLVKLIGDAEAAMGGGKLTSTGLVFGTPAYMAPEQARGDAPIDARCDIYSLGATLFELIGGRPPHLGPGRGHDGQPLDHGLPRRGRRLTARPGPQGA